MQANSLTIQSHPSAGQINVTLAAGSLAGTVKGWLTRMVGCWHKEMSRPFSSQGQAYRVCLNCGARRHFNLGNWEMQGNFYYSLPKGKQFRTLNGLASVRRVVG